jgi:hypothetical protein
MGTSHLSLDMDVTLDVRPRRPISDGAPAVFESLLEVFTPRELRIILDDGPVLRLGRHSSERYGKSELWFDEETVAGEVFTQCSAGATGELISQLRTRLANHPTSSVFIRAEGGLRHSLPGGDTAWYGRWRITTPPALVHLVVVRLEWTADSHAFWFDLPVEGYPLTSTQLGPTEFVKDGDSSAAAVNRAAIIPVLGRVPASLGLETGEVQWSVGGDAPNRYKEDTRDIYDVWLPRLKAV